MNQLYPIVRRVRRPLLPVEAPSLEQGAVSAPAPVNEAGNRDDVHFPVSSEAKAVSPVFEDPK
jgi:hypothetical protein